MSSKELTKAVDVSLWSGAVSHGTWTHIKQLGYRLAIVGSWHGIHANTHAIDQFNEASNLGLHTATYVVLNDHKAHYSMDKARELCGDYYKDLKFVALDIEVDGLTTNTIEDAINIIKVDGLKPIIYTGKWFWKGHLGNPKDFKDIPLWPSIYDGKLDLSFPINKRFGGWTKLFGKQYAGSATRLGIKADLSVFDTEKLYKL